MRFIFAVWQSGENYYGIPRAHTREVSGQVLQCYKLRRRVRDMDTFQMESCIRGYFSTVFTHIHIRAYTKNSRTFNFCHLSNQRKIFNGDNFLVFGSRICKVVIWRDEKNYGHRQIFSLYVCVCQVKEGPLKIPSVCWELISTTQALVHLLRKDWIILDSLIPTSWLSQSRTTNHLFCFKVRFEFKKCDV